MFTTRLRKADLLLMPLTVLWRDSLTWQLQSCVQILPSSQHKVLNEHVEGKCLEIILVLEIEHRRQRLLWQSSLLLFVNWHGLSSVGIQVCFPVT